MHIRIYQINSDRDVNHVKSIRSDSLERFQGAKEIDSSIYDKVFDGDVDCATLEDVFRQFNTVGHPLHRGHSLSVSDVVELTDTGTHHFCDTVGFKEIPFDASKTQAEEGLLRIVMVEPHRPPYISEIAPVLGASQAAVGGFIEHVHNDDGTLIVCNESGKLDGLDGNRRITGDVIAGSFFVVGDGGEDYRSLTDEECDRYMQRFAEPEDISQEELDANSGFFYVSW